LYQKSGPDDEMGVASEVLSMTSAERCGWGILREVAGIGYRRLAI
jgi:hypothetical protein